MPRYTYKSRLSLLMIERGMDTNAALGRAAQFISDYEISEHEIAGFNLTTGSKIRSIVPNFVQSESFVVSDHNEDITAHITIDLTVDLEADDHPAAKIAGRSVDTFFEFSPEFCSGYNDIAGTKISHFELVGFDVRGISENAP